MSGIIGACRIKTNPAGDWQVLPPAGQITQIGDAGATAWGLVANDDLFVSGHCEVGNILYVNDETWLSDDLGVKTAMSFYGPNGDVGFYAWNYEKIAIPIGQGAAGVLSAANLCPENSIILAVVGRVNAAPGGGATVFDVGRHLIANAEFADDIGVALHTTFVSPTDGDGSNAGPVHNAAACQIKITTDVNVTIAIMRIRVTVFYLRLYPPTA